MRAAVHVGVRGAGRHRLPRGAGAERAAAVPRGDGAAGRAVRGARPPDGAARARQARRAGNTTQAP